MNPNQQNPYDFLNTNSGPKKSLFGSSSKKTRIIQVAIFAVIIIVLIVVAANFLTAGSKETTEKLIKVAAAQQDLIEVAKQGTTNAREPINVSRSATTESIVLSQNNDLVAYLQKNKVKNIDKQVSSYRDDSYKKTLDEAKKNGNYDEVYAAIYSNRLDLYRSTLQAAYASVEGPTIKKLLENSYSQLATITPESQTTQ